MSEVIFKEKKGYKHLKETFTEGAYLQEFTVGGEETGTIIYDPEGRPDNPFTVHIDKHTDNDALNALDAELMYGDSEVGGEGPTFKTREAVQEAIREAVKNG